MRVDSPSSGAVRGGEPLAQKHTLTHTFFSPFLTMAGSSAMDTSEALSEEALEAMVAKARADQKAEEEHLVGLLGAMRAYGSTLLSAEHSRKAHYQHMPPESKALLGGSGHRDDPWLTRHQHVRTGEGLVTLSAGA